MELRLSVLSECGGRATNEDACGYWRQSGPLCCVLSDGAGGHGGGDVASRIAVSSVLRDFADAPAVDGEYIGQLIERANGDVLEAQHEGGRVADMHATLVVLAIDPQARRAAWGHVGDSRLYLVRAGRVAHVTHDHSLLQSMIDAGFVDPRSADDHPGRDILTAALGSAQGCLPEFVLEPLSLADGDVFLLCSDGLWGSVGDRIASRLQTATSPDDWLSQLACDVRELARAGQDNYSAIAVWCEP